MDHLQFQAMMKHEGTGAFNQKTTSVRDRPDQITSPGNAHNYSKAHEEYMSNLRNLQQQEYRNKLLGYFMNIKNDRINTPDLIGSTADSLSSFSISRPQSPDNNPSKFNESSPPRSFATEQNNNYRIERPRICSPEGISASKEYFASMRGSFSPRQGNAFFQTFPVGAVTPTADSNDPRSFSQLRSSPLLQHSLIEKRNPNTEIPNNHPTCEQESNQTRDVSPFPSTSKESYELQYQGMDKDRSSERFIQNLYLHTNRHGQTINNLEAVDKTTHARTDTSSGEMSNSDSDEYIEKKMRKYDSQRLFSIESQSSSTSSTNLLDTKNEIENYEDRMIQSSLIPGFPPALPISPLNSNLNGLLTPQTQIAGPLISSSPLISSLALASSNEVENNDGSSPPDLIMARAIAATRGLKKPRSEKKPIPNSMKDNRYFERRKRNNAAAKKSRDARKRREDEIARKASVLESENSFLRKELINLRAQFDLMSADLIQRGFPLLNLFNLNSIHAFQQSSLDKD